jgi:hypothetical protein
MTSEELIKSVKSRAMIPTNQVTFSEIDFLRFANEEMQIGLVPSILSFHEEYLHYVIDVPLVTGQIRYDIPDRAIGTKLRDVSFVDSNNNYYNMTRIQPEDLPFYQGFSFGISQRQFYLEAGQVVLAPDSQNTFGPSDKLRVRYYMRPNKLVHIDDVSVVTNIDRNTGVITVDQVPDRFTNSSLYDFIQIKSPHRTLAFDVPIIGTTSTTFTLDPADIPSTLSVGDHINLAGETVIPQIPDELHVVLAQRVACRCLEALGDREGLAAANQKLAEMEVKTGMLIDNRVEGAPQKIVNHFTPLRQNLFRRKLIRY